MRNKSLIHARQPARRRRDFAAAAALGAAAMLLLGMHGAHAANDAWSTAPVSANFSGTNWTTGATVPGAATGTIAAGDILYFGTSSTTTLTDDETAGFSLGGFTFNAGAAAFTIAGNSFALNGGITNNSTNLQTINDAFTMAATQTFTTTTGGGNLTLGGIISGNGGLTAAGTGTLTLSGSNSFAGGLTINGGTVISTTSGSSTGLGTGSVTVNTGGTLQGNAGNSFGYNGGSSPSLITIAGGTVTSGTNGSYTVTLPDLTFNGGGLLSPGSGNTGGGNGNFSTNSQGAGTAKFTVINALGTTAQITGGTIGIQHMALDFVVGAGSAASQLTVSSSLIDCNGTGKNVIKDGMGTLTFTNSEKYTGSTTVNAGTLVLRGGYIDHTSQVTINNGGTISVQGDNNYLYNNPTQTTTINSGGLLTITADSATAHLGPLALAGGTLGSTGTPSGDGLKYGSWNLDKGVTAGGTAATSTISAMSVALTQSGGTVFNVASGASSGIDLDVTGTLAHTTGAGDTGLIKTGTGVMRLSNTNTYTSGTTVSGGTLALSAAAADGSGALVVNSGGTVTVTANNATGSGNVTLTNGTILNANTGANGIRSSNTAPTNNTQNMGILTLGNGTSILDFGAGNTGAIFSFADSHTAAWTGTLSVYDWKGGYPTSYNPSTQIGTTGGDGLDQLYFGGSSSGLTLAQLKDIKFYSDAGSTLLGNGTSIILADGEVSPAPEPAEVATLSMIGLGLGGLLLKARKRKLTPKLS